MRTYPLQSDHRFKSAAMAAVSDKCFLKMTIRKNIHTRLDCFPCIFKVDCKDCISRKLIFETMHVQDNAETHNL